MSKRTFLLTGIVLIIVAIILGAFGALALKSILLDYPEKLNSFETGVKYQMYMGVSFLWYGTSKLEAKKTLFILWILGVMFFSFSIYILSISHLLSFSVKFLGPITPIGGLLLIVGWVYLFFHVLKSKK